MSEQAGRARAGFFEVATIEPLEVAAGVTLRLVSGDKAMLSFVTLQPGAMVPLHSHPHEQLGTGLEGELMLYIGGLEPEHGRLIRSGDSYVIPGGVLHAARNDSNAPCVALDVFSPLREDYHEMFRSRYNKEVVGLQKAD